MRYFENRQHRRLQDSQCLQSDPIESIKWYINGDCSSEDTTAQFPPYGYESFYNKKHSSNGNCWMRAQVKCSRDQMAYRFFNDKYCKGSPTTEEIYDLNKCTGYVVRMSASGSVKSITRAPGGTRPTHYLKIKALMVPVKEPTAVVKTDAPAAKDSTSKGEAGPKIKPNKDDEKAAAGAKSGLGIAVAAAALAFSSSYF